MIKLGMDPRSEEERLIEEFQMEAQEKKNGGQIMLTLSEGNQYQP